MSQLPRPQRIRRYRAIPDNLSIAIIIRTKDRPHLLTRCLQSLADQKRSPDEVIIVNDAGTDISAVVQRFDELSIQLINLPTNQGRAQAGNLGVEAAQSQVIGFLDDDDSYYPDHLQRLEKAMLHFDAKVAYSGCRLLQRDMQGDDSVLQETPLGVYNEPFDAARLQYENYIPLINLLIDRTLWQTIGGFDTRFDIFEDWDMLLRLVQHTGFYHLNRVTADYVIWGSGQITRATQREQWFNAYRKIIHKHLLPLAEAAQLDLLAEYWRLSQQRRGVMQEAQSELSKLQLELLDNQQKLLELAHQQAQQRSEHEQQLHEKIQQFNQLQQHTQRQQTHFEEQVKQYERQIDQQYTTLKQHQQQYEKLQEAHDQQAQAFQQQATELQGNYAKLEQEHHKLQQLTQATQMQNQTLQMSVDELSKQHALGISKATLDKFLQSRTEFYTLNNQDENKVITDYQRLAEWIRDKAAALQSMTQEAAQQTPALQAQHAALQSQVQHLIDLLGASRWPQVRRYINAVQEIGEQATALFTTAHPPLQAVTQWPEQLGLTHLAKVTAETAPWEMPPPRELSAVYPVFTAVAGNAEQPILMESVPEQHPIPLFLEPNVALVFTTSCNADHFFRLEILLATCVRINTSHVRVIVRELYSDAVLRVVYLESMEVFDNYYATIEFDPIQDSAGKTYQIEFDSPDATPTTAIAVWCHHKPPFTATDQRIPITQLFHNPDDLPPMLQYGLLNLPATDAFSSHAPHVFLVNGISLTTSVLQLHLFLLQLHQALHAAAVKGRVVLFGQPNPTVAAYCEQHQLTLFAALTFTESLGWLKQQTDAAWGWCCHIQALPVNDSVERAMTLFNGYPETGMLVPLEQDNEAKIRAGYAWLMRDSSMKLPTGELASYPQHRFCREIYAASSQLVLLRIACLAHLDLNAIAAYQTHCYQVTDLIWQLLEHQQSTRYQASWHYLTEQPVTYFEASACEQDLQLFSKRWAAQLPAHTAPFVLEMDALLNPRQQPNVLIIDATLPTYDEDSGSLRLYTLIKIWVALGYRLSFFPDNLDSNLKYREALEHLGVEVFHGIHSIGEVLATRHYDFAFICRVDIGHRHMPFVHLMSPETIIFYDTVDIHYVREERQAEIENNPKLLKQAQATKRRELYNCKMADKVITVTDDDGLHLQKELPFLQYAVLPNIHTAHHAAIPSYTEREGLVFIGNYNHTPNEDAVYFFIENVLPNIIVRLPTLKFYVVGSNIRAEMRQLASEQVEIVGWVDEVPPEFARRRVFVSYLRYGAGMKGKLGQALSLGLPIVTTSIGAEGMGLIEGETALIADDPDDFADAVCRLYTEQVLWEKLSQQGQAYIEAEYGETAFEEKLRGLLAEYT